VLFSITIYDACNVPVAWWSAWIDTTAGTYCHPELGSFTVQITLPEWAFISPPYGKIYVTALTALPVNSGVAYCPMVQFDALNITL
jgi:hypothetical protein